MGVSKINYGTKTVMDLSKDTVTASKLLKGITAHDKNGDQITGTYEGDGSGSTEIDKTGNGAYAWAKYNELIDYVETSNDVGVNKPSGYSTTKYTGYTVTKDGYYELDKSVGINEYYLPRDATNGKTKTILYRAYGYRSHYKVLTLSDENTFTLSFLSGISITIVPHLVMQRELKACLKFEISLYSSAITSESIKCPFPVAFFASLKVVYLLL